MTFLFIVKQKKNVDTFQDVIARLLAHGHRVKLAIQERGEVRDRRLLTQFDCDRFELVGCPDGRRDEWRGPSPLLRSAQDWVQYFRDPYVHASKLRQRATDRLARELGTRQQFDGEAIRLGPLQATRLREALGLLEALVPSDPLHEEFIAGHQPDVVLVTPGLHFGSAQADFIKSARALRVPVWMLLFSWDNLSTKGALHVFPDLMFVWNERQRREAEELHGYPSDRVIVTGAPRFDEFFALRNVLRRDEFLAPLALDASRPTLLYVCSSRFIAARELSFIREWLAALRSAPHAALRECNVIVRPHPDVTLVESDETPETVTWPGLPHATGWVQRALGDPRAIVLRTSYGSQQAFYECLFHAAATVGLNTSAELEAGIAGRPVFTVNAACDAADGQASTLHFDYLLREHAGFVVSAPDMASHVDQLGAAITQPPDAEGIRSFIMQFLRPHGDRPVSDLLAERLAAAAADRSTVERSPTVSARHRPGRHPMTVVSEDRDSSKRLALGSPGSKERLFATPEARRSRRDNTFVPDAAAVAWLEEHVNPGDVLFDIGAGIGAYAVLGANQRGAMVIAFEPGFASFKRLCDNLLLNGCSGSVVPIPIALGDRTGLLELVYAGADGGDRHVLRARTWRSRREAIESSYTQPVCAERLEDVVRRFRLPQPNAIRIAGRGSPLAILAGAAPLLRRRQLRSILVSIAGDKQDHAVSRALKAYGFSAASTARIDDKHRTVCLLRTSPPGIANRGRELLGRLTGRSRY